MFVSSPGYCGSFIRRLLTSAIFCAVGFATVHFCILLPLAGFSPIGGSSEAREAHIANSILQSGEWVLPLRNGMLPSKPPLYHWITALLGMPAGEVTPFIARLTTLLFSSGILFLVAWFLLRISRAGPSTARRNAVIVAALGATILVSTHGFQVIAADARVDVTYSFFVTAALVSILSALTSADRRMISRDRVWDIFFLACALGTLAKGPLAIVLPTIIAGAMLWATLGLRNAVSVAIRPRRGWILFIVVVLPWYLIAWQRGGQDFLERQLLFENIQRFSGGQDVNAEAFWFYIPSFLRTAFPWSLLVFACVPATVRYFRHRGQCKPEPFAAYRQAEELAALWFWIGFLFLSLASGKRHSYLLPLFPGMAIFLALRAERFLHEASDSLRARLMRMAYALPILLGIVLIVIAGAFDLLRYPIIHSTPLWEELRQFLSRLSLRIEVLLTVAAVLCLFVGLFRSSSMSRRSVACFIGVAAIFSSIIVTGLSIKNFVKGFDRDAHHIVSAVPPDEELSVVREPREEFFDPLLYYLKREVTLIQRDLLPRRCPATIVIREKDLRHVQQAQPKLNFKISESFMSLDQRYRDKQGSLYYLARCTG